MKALQISDSESMIHALQDEIRRSDSSWYEHRLHSLLLVAGGMSCRKVALIYGDSHRSVVNWVHQFEKRGFSGLQEKEGRGRKASLKPSHLTKINQALRKSPREFKINASLWDGKTLSEYIQISFGIGLGVRQCQRLFRQLDFRAILV